MEESVRKKGAQNKRAVSQPAKTSLGEESGDRKKMVRLFPVLRLFFLLMSLTSGVLSSRRGPVDGTQFGQPQVSSWRMALPVPSFPGNRLFQNFAKRLGLAHDAEWFPIEVETRIWSQ